MATAKKPASTSRNVEKTKVSSPVKKSTTKKTVATDEKQSMAPVVPVVPLQSVSTPPSQKGGSMQEKLVPVMAGALVVAAFVVGLLYGKLSVYENGGVATKPAAGTPTADAGNQVAPPPEVMELDDASWEKIVDGAEYAKGDEDAPVTLVEFTDYQCPFCSQFFTQTYGQIMSDYVETGKVRYITRELPLSFHANAHVSAEAAQCAGKQDKYFEMHDKLFETQAEWSNLSDPKEKFGEYAADLGLNTRNFNSCLESGETAEAVDADLALSQQVGASGTPTFFINGKKLVGAQPYTAFQAALDEALAE